MAGLQRVCAQLLPSDDGVCLPLCIIELGGLLFEKSPHMHCNREGKQLALYIHGSYGSHDPSQAVAYSAHTNTATSSKKVM